MYDDNTTTQQSTANIIFPGNKSGCEVQKRKLERKFIDGAILIEFVLFEATENSIECMLFSSMYVFSHMYVFSSKLMYVFSSIYVFSSDYHSTQQLDKLLTSLLNIHTYAHMCEKIIFENQITLIHQESSSSTTSITSTVC